MFDNPIFFLILISLISAISEWLGKRRKAKRLAEEEPEVDLPFPSEAEVTAEPKKEEPHKRGPGPQQEWEERLRRLLEGDDAETKPTPPVARAPEPPRVPHQPSVEIKPEPFADAVLDYSPPSNPSPPPIPVTPKPVVAEVPSAAALVRSDKNAQKIGNKSRKSAKPRVVGPQVAGFRSRRALKQAVVAAVVLGPPKGSAEEADILRL